MLQVIRGEVKGAWKTLKRHYFVLVLVCIIVMFLGGEFFGTAQFIRKDLFSGEVTSQEEKLDIYHVLSLWQKGAADDSVHTAENLMEQLIDKATDNRVFGHSKGVFADWVNKITSGYFFVQLLTMLSSLFHSRNAARAIVSMMILLIFCTFWIFVRNMCVVVSRRMVLEGRCYEQLSIRRAAHFYRLRKWMHIAWVMLVSYTLQILWYCTVVGGPVKRYAYYLVPYIIAENPYLSAREAITLSRNMMQGHKKEMFFRELLFLLAPGFAVLTGGLSDVFFVNPFRIAFFSEAYAGIREEAKRKKVEGIECLNDEALFSRLDPVLLELAYTDALDVKEQTRLSEKSRKKFFRVLADWFGLIFAESEEERAYERLTARRGVLEEQTAQLEGRAYPIRFCPAKEYSRRAKQINTGYLCHYSVWSLIILFVLFSCIGWIWEVSLHLFTSGEFINRGVLQGPWIPIYGTGGVLILLLLYRFRARPELEFALSICLAGIVEFGTFAVMEISHDGMRWWDYSGYFLNFGGRVCAEGLLVFGVGGMTVVYLVAPAVNNWLRRRSWKKVVFVSLILGILFCADTAYSSKHPNTGKGITTGSVQMEQK